MKRKTKFGLGITALCAGVLMLSGCTASFCTTKDQSNVLYAYDDGIPELGFGVRPAGGKFAVRFDLAEYDTIQGVQLLFNHTLNDANDKYFDIVIWKDENGRPSDEVYRMRNLRPRWGDQPYQFQYYEFQQPVMLSGSFSPYVSKASSMLQSWPFLTSS